MADGAGLYGAAATLAATSPWSDAAVADLWKWWPEGVSALQISKRLTAAYGHAYTRCAVIAKVHREKGLSDVGRDKPSAPKVTLSSPLRVNAWSDSAAELIGRAWQAGLSGDEVAAKYTGKLDGGRLLPPSSVRTIAERAGFLRSPESYKTTVATTNRIRVRRASAPKAGTAKAGFNAPAYSPPVVFGNIVVRRPDTQHEPVEVAGMLALPLWQRPDNGCCFVCGEADNGEALYCSLPVDRATRQKTYCTGHLNNMRRPSAMKAIAPPPEGPRRIAAPKADGFLARWA